MILQNLFVEILELALPFHTIKIDGSQWVGTVKLRMKRRPSHIYLYNSKILIVLPLRIELGLINLHSYFSTLIKTKYIKNP